MKKIKNKKNILNNSYAVAFDEDGANPEDLRIIAISNITRIKDLAEYFESLSNSRVREVRRDIDSYSRKVEALKNATCENPEDSAELKEIISYFVRNQKNAEDYHKFVCRNGYLFRTIINEIVSNQKDIIENVSPRKFLHTKRDESQMITYIG